MSPTILWRLKSVGRKNVFHYFWKNDMLTLIMVFVKLRFRLYYKINNNNLQYEKKMSFNTNISLFQYKCLSFKEFIDIGRGVGTIGHLFIFL